MTAANGWNSSGTVNGVDFLDLLAAVPTAMRALFDQKDVALAKSAFPGIAVDEGDAAVEQVHQLIMAIGHGKAVIGVESQVPQTNSVSAER